MLCFYYPSYTCAVSGQDWSVVLILDPRTLQNINGRLDGNCVDEKRNSSSVKDKQTAPVSLRKRLGTLVRMKFLWGWKLWIPYR